MDPTTDKLDISPRSLSEDAFFQADRSSVGVVRRVRMESLPARGRTPTASDIDIPGFRSRHQTQTHVATNPLRHARMTAPRKSGGVPDASIAKWDEVVAYISFLTPAAARIVARPSSAKLQIILFFGVGSEAHRHGLCGSVAQTTEPNLLIIVPGIEPQHEIQFRNPVNPRDKKTLTANARWGVGITEVQIASIVTTVVGRNIDYNVTVLAAYSTGYLGLAGELSGRLAAIDKLRRIVIFDCLYAELRAPLTLAQSTNKSIKIVAYVVTGAGNSFADPKTPTLASLTLGGLPGWTYIDLIFNPFYHALASCRVVQEARTPGNPIVTALPASYLVALGALASKLPARLTVVSDPRAFAKLGRTLPSSATDLRTFTASAAKELRLFHSQVATTRKCLGNAQLLGWPTPDGEEWHDMLLVDFAWEYLT